MSLKEDWKETGKGLGDAFAGLGKNLLRSGKTGVDKAADWAEDKENEAEEAGKESNVFNDGSWRETGKDLGSAFANLGKSLLKSARTGVDKATEWAEDKPEDEKQE